MEKAKQILDTLLERSVILLMGAIVLTIVWQVISRYIFNSPSEFTDELSRYLLIWVGILVLLSKRELKKYINKHLINRQDAHFNNNS